MENIRAIRAIFKDAAFDGRANGLRFTRAALIDRYLVIADAIAQNRPNLVDAQRRRVHPTITDVYPSGREAQAIYAWDERPRFSGFNP